MNNPTLDSEDGKIINSEDAINAFNTLSRQALLDAIINAMWPLLPLVLRRHSKRTVRCNHPLNTILATVGTVAVLNKITPTAQALLRTEGSRPN